MFRIVETLFKLPTQQLQSRTNDGYFIIWLTFIVICITILFKNLSKQTKRPIDPWSGNINKSI